MAGWVPLPVKSLQSKAVYICPLAASPGQYQQAQAEESSQSEETEQTPHPAAKAAQCHSGVLSSLLKPLSSLVATTLSLSSTRDTLFS